METHIEQSLSSLEDKYDILGPIGEGKFGVVYKIKDKETGEIFAAKAINKKDCMKERLNIEIETMKSLNHERIVKLFSVVEDDDTIFLIMECVEGGELFDWLLNNRGRSERQVVHIVSQILAAAAYIHEKNMIHRDIKPENILCERCGGDGTKDYDFTNEDPNYPNIKISDFGLARLLDKSDKRVKRTLTYCGTPDYVAPEIISHKKYDHSVDMWSIGVTTYILLTGYLPFGSRDINTLFTNVKTERFDWKESPHVSDQAKTFVKKLLQKNPKKRYTARAALKDPWIDGLSLHTHEDTGRPRRDSFAGLHNPIAWITKKKERKGSIS